MLRAAKNGCSSEINFKGRKVYHDWQSGVPMSCLGEKLDKTEFLKSIVDETNLKAVENLMIDWHLYENGWHVHYDNCYKNKHLFYYLQQMGGYGGHRPKELEYFN
tara:strand:- start:494 stop:808 length:315 start_codon:yes stop_codon:yes gene_type:complete